MYVLSIEQGPPISNRSSATILQRVAAKDPTAIDDCLTEYGGLVWRLARRYLDHVPGDVDDAVQEVFVELWLNAKRFDPEAGSEPAFVATVAHRRLIDFQRRVTSQRRAVRKVEGAGLAPSLTHNGTSRADTAELAVEFDKLPDDERHAIWLAIHSGMTQRQISEVTKSPIGTVKTRIRRGLARLHAALSHRSESAPGRTREGGVS